MQQSKVEFIELKDITGLPPTDELKKKPLPEIAKILGELKYEDAPVLFSPRFKNTPTMLAYLIINEIVQEITQGESRIYFYHEPGSLKAIFRHFGQLQDVNLTTDMLGLAPDYSQISIQSPALMDSILKFFLNCAELDSYKKFFSPGSSIHELEQFYQTRQQLFPQSPELKDNSVHLLERFVPSLYTTSFYQILNSFLRSHGCRAKPFGAEDDEKASDNLYKQDSTAVNLQVKVILLFNCLLHQSINKLGKTALPSTTDQKKLLTVRSETIAKGAGFFSERLKKIQEKGVVAEPSPMSTAMPGVEFIPEASGEPNVYTVILQEAGQITYSADVQALSQYPDEIEQLLPPLQELKYIKVIKDEAKDTTFLIAKPVITIENCNEDHQAIPELMRKIEFCLNKLISLALLESGNPLENLVRLFTGIPQKSILIRSIRAFSQEYSWQSQQILARHLKNIATSCEALNSPNQAAYKEYLHALGKLFSQFTLKRPAVDSLEIQP